MDLPAPTAENVVLFESGMQIKAVLAKALHPEPHNRYMHAEDMVKDWDWAWFKLEKEMLERVKAGKPSLPERPKNPFEYEVEEWHYEPFTPLCYNPPPELANMDCL